MNAASRLILTLVRRDHIWNIPAFQKNTECHSGYGMDILNGSDAFSGRRYPGCAGTDRGVYRAHLYLYECFAQYVIRHVEKNRYLKGNENDV